MANWLSKLPISFSQRSDCKKQINKESVSARRVVLTTGTKKTLNLINELALDLTIFKLHFLKLLTRSANLKVYVLMLN